MLTNLTTEIQGYLHYNDFALAKRRLLDAALDTNNLNIIQEATQKAALFNESATKNDIEIGIANLLQQMESTAVSATTFDKPFIYTRNISKAYPSGNFQLKPVSFSIEGNHVFGLVGENGNGKTTLLRCLSGELIFDQGNITYSVLQQKDFYQIKSDIAFIPQRIPRWFGKLKDNLHFSATAAGVVGKENEVMVAFMLERFDLQKFANLTWDQISSGYKTRFEIARILLKKPKLLFLDEPLANLDINAQQTLLIDLKLLAKSKRNPLAIILSSQQLYEVEKIADAVLFIKNGNCIIENKTKTTEEKVVDATAIYTIELESNNSREEIIAALKSYTVEIKYNGNAFTISTSNCSSATILETLVQQKVAIQYFRDISNSTKRFF